MTQPAVPLRFGRFELQPHERRLLKGGLAVALGARAFDVLLALAERPGRLVGKRALMELVWPGLVVQDNNLAAQVSALRKAIGDDLIATIPGRGYRFTGQIESAAPEPPAPRAKATTALRTNLPSELPALLGRDDDLSALGALVDRYRLVSIVGAGGIGKSLLAQHLLLGRRGAYPQGVCWVELGAVADDAALPGAVAAALGLEGGHGDALNALLNALTPLTMLLALDNAEHLLAGVATLARALHDAAPALRIVVTSQAPLKARAEHVLRLAPLTTPAADLPLAQARAFGAVALFAERAHAVDRSFALTDANLPAVSALCRALDGLPLAIELAAARVPTLGVPKLLASLRERLQLLTANRDRAAPQRQQTLRAALQWSHDLLSPIEQRVFRRLGVFAGSASLASIVDVVSDADRDGAERFAVIDTLDALVDRSLVTVLAAQGDGEPRYRLLESPRTYALEQLDAAGERPDLQRRHAMTLADDFDAAYEQFFGGSVGVDAWLSAREADFDNARAALQWARASADVALELRIGATLLRALPPSLHAERMALVDSCEARIDATVPEPLQMRTLIELSCVLADSQKARGRRCAERALQLARALDAHEPDRFALYHALCRAASAAAQCGEPAAARTLLKEALTLQDSSWPAQRLLWGAEATQWCARMTGDLAAALASGRRLLALDIERGSDATLARSNLVDAELAAGNAEHAARAGAELVQVLQSTRHEYGLTCARINLLAAQLALDDHASARPVAEAVWAKAPAFELQHAAAACLALGCALQDRPGAAVQLVGYSEAIYARRGEPREHNETAATQRALALAQASLTPEELTRHLAAGARLRDADVAAIAFARDRL